MADLLHNPQHWRKRAMEARSAAEMACDPESERQLLNIALSCERLAILIEERVKGTKPKPDSK